MVKCIEQGARNSEDHFKGGGGVEECGGGCPCRVLRLTREVCDEAVLLGAASSRTENPETVTQGREFRRLTEV